VWRSTGGTVRSSFCSVGGLAAVAAVAVLADLALKRHAAALLDGPTAYAPTVLLALRLLVPLAAALPVAATLAFRSARSQARYIRQSMHALGHAHAYCARPSTKGPGYAKSCWVYPGPAVGSIAGVVVLHGNEIEFLFVDATARRKGVASALLGVAEGSCRAATVRQTGALAFSSMQLTVTAAQPDAMNFCE
jgi:GNAT superfamily N-acetyltransferase